LASLKNDTSFHGLSITMNMPKLYSLSKVSKNSKVSISLMRNTSLLEVFISALSNKFVCA
jgi:hypothetical protein